MKQLDDLYTAGSGVEACPEEAASRVLHPQVEWHVAHPVNGLTGVGEVVEHFLQPLLAALPDLERKPFIDLPGRDRGQDWRAGTGYFIGMFQAPLFGIPPTHKTLYLRYTELVRCEDGLIRENYLILDFLDAMAQAGAYPLRAAAGHPGLIMPPSSLDGLALTSGETQQSRDSLQLVNGMLDCLRRYDGLSLESMDLENYWHPDFMWYGPGGIGTTRGIDGFRRHHQGPFLAGFPDRDVDHHACTIASGDYVATGGWPHMHGTHLGGGWLGLPPSGRRLELRVMDIWRREDRLLRENWVAIDIPHMLQQMGLDVFSQVSVVASASLGD